jgi:uncharacterized protein with von Willebrand factor type A (vWA) domain
MKKYLINFIKINENNRIWLVYFAWKTFVSTSLTFDYNFLEENIKKATIIKNDNFQWTDISKALLSAKNIFDKRKEKNREKIIILITDWKPDHAEINPILTAKYLNDIRIYSIWIWWYKKAYCPIIKNYVPPLNDKYLKEISQITNWKYFRANSNRTFETIFKNYRN